MGGPCGSHVPAWCKDLLTIFLFFWTFLHIPAAKPPTHGGSVPSSPSPEQLHTVPCSRCCPCAYPARVSRLSLVYWAIILPRSAMVKEGQRKMDRSSCKRLNVYTIINRQCLFFIRFHSGGGQYQETASGGQDQECIPGRNRAGTLAQAVLGELQRHPGSSILQSTLEWSLTRPRLPHWVNILEDVGMGPPALVPGPMPHRVSRRMIAGHSSGT